MCKKELCEGRVNASERECEREEDEVVCGYEGKAGEVCRGGEARVRGRKRWSCRLRCDEDKWLSLSSN